MTREILTQICSLLEEVISNQLDPDAAIRAWPHVDASKTPEVRWAWEQLQHYAIDADIRARDAEYARAQEEKLRRCCDAIAALITLTRN